MSLTPPPILVQQGIGIARETSFGNGDGPNIWYHGISNDFRRKPDKRPMGGMTGSMAPYVYNPNGSRVYEGMTKLNGPLSIWAEFDDIGHWLSAMYGPPSTASNSPVSGAHTHTWTLPRAVPSSTPTSLAVGSVGFQEDVRAKGCLPNKMMLRGTPDNVVVATFDMVGQGGANIQQNDTVGTISTAPWMEFFRAKLRWASAAGTASGSLTDQTGAQSIRSFEIACDNNLRVEQAAGDGEIGPREFTYKGARTMTLGVVRDNIDDQFFNDMYDADPDNWFNSVELSIDSGTQYITGSTPYSLAVYSPAALLHGDPPGATSDDVIPEALRWTFSDNLTDALATITLVNGTATGGYGS